MWTLLLLTTLAADPACDPSLPDADGDGLDGGSDCDDCDPGVWVGADELCDGVDNDCDEVVDEVTSPNARDYYADRDGDGYGDVNASIKACGQPEGYVERAGDCDDDNFLQSPALPELCDGVDNDCDGQVDIAPINGVLWGLDRDGDGVASATTAFTCEPPGPRWIEASGTTDLDDTNPNVAFATDCAQARPGPWAGLALLLLRRRRAASLTPPRTPPRPASGSPTPPRTPGCTR